MGEGRRRRRRPWLGGWSFRRDWGSRMGRSWERRRGSCVFIFETFSMFYIRDWGRGPVVDRFGGLHVDI